MLRLKACALAIFNIPNSIKNIKFYYPLDFLVAIFHAKIINGKSHVVHGELDRLIDTGVKYANWYLLAHDLGNFPSSYYSPL